MTELLTSLFVLAGLAAWILALVDLLRRERGDFPDLAGGRWTGRRLWILALVTLNPLLALLYLWVVRWRRPALARGPRTALVLGGFAVALFLQSGLWTPHLGAWRPGADAWLQTNLHQTASESSWSNVPESPLPPLRRLRLVVGAHPTLELAGERLAEELRALPGVEEVEVRRAADPLGDREPAPDATLVLHGEVRTLLWLPMAQITRTSTWLQLASHTVLTRPGGTFSSSPEGAIAVQYDGASSGLGLWLGSALLWGRHGAGAEQILEAAGPKVLELVSGVHGAAQSPPASLARFEEGELPAALAARAPRRIGSECSLLVPHRSFHAFVDDRAAVRVLEELASGLEPDGWSVHVDEDSAALRATRGEELLEVGPWTHRTGLTDHLRVGFVEDPPQPRGRAGQEFLARYRRVHPPERVLALLEEARSAAQLDAALPALPPGFLTEHDRGGPFHQRYLQLWEAGLEGRPGARPGSWLWLAHQLADAGLPERAQTAADVGVALAELGPGSLDQRDRERLEQAGLTILEAPAPAALERAGFELLGEAGEFDVTLAPGRSAGFVLTRNEDLRALLVRFDPGPPGERIRLSCGGTWIYLDEPDGSGIGLNSVFLRAPRVETLANGLRLRGELGLYQ